MQKIVILGASAPLSFTTYYRFQPKAEIGKIV